MKMKVKERSKGRLPTSWTCRIKPKGALLISILLIPAVALSAQDIVENPDKPSSPNAGRILPLKEIMRITDEEGRFFFKQPGCLSVGGDGSIYYGDWDEFLYKFNAKGKFLKNLARKGEGPGEVRDFGEFLLEKDRIILLDTMPNKIITMDLDGKLIDEFSLGQKRFPKLIAFYDNHYFLTDYLRKDFERKSGLKETGHDLYVVSRKGEATKTPWGFPTTESWFFSERGSSVGTITWIQKAQARDRFVYLSSTQDYLVKLLDLDKQDVVRTFRRTYKPVKFEPPAREKQFYRERGFPECHNDIQKLLVHGDHLWVLTSTIEKDKGILTDVFDREGKYVDCFYLPLPRLKRNWIGFPPMTISGSFLYTVEWDEDANIFIVKYQIGELE
jgi:hypothetical protein